MENSDQIARRAALNVATHFIGRLAWTIAFGSTLAAVHWVSVAPRSPDFARGAVFAFNNRSATVYLTARQEIVVVAGLLGGVLIFLLAFRVMPKRDVVVRKSFLSWSMTFKRDDPEGIGRWAGVTGIVAGLLIVQMFDPALLAWCVGQVRHVLR